MGGREGQRENNGRGADSPTLAAAAAAAFPHPSPALPSTISATSTQWQESKGGSVQRGQRSALVVCVSVCVCVY